MAWLGKKIDSLIGAVFAAVGGLAFSQLQAFMHHYLQRLGGHLDEAKRNLQAILESERYQTLDDASRQTMTDAAQGRAVEIEFAHESIKGADTLVKPFVFLANLKPDVALRVIADFQPALPLDAVSLIYALVGTILGLAVHELFKLPLEFASPGTW